MKFDTGDLVKVMSASPLFASIQDKESIGIIMKPARLMYAHHWDQEECLVEFWAYELTIEGQTFENVPEEGLRGIE